MRVSHEPTDRGLWLVGAVLLAAMAGLLPTGSTRPAVAAGSTAARPAATVGWLRSVSANAAGDVVATYRYATNSPEDEVGDVYYNTTWGPDTHPAVVIVHGGWWHNGTRKAAERAAARFFGAGFVVYNVDLRLAADQQRADGTVNPGDRWPAQRIDVELAVRFLKANAATFGTASDRIASYGFSSGGHLVTLAAGYYRSVTVAASVGAILQPHRTADIALHGTWGADVATPTIVKSFGYITSILGCSYEPSWYNCGRKWTSFKPETYFSAGGPGIYAVKGALDPIEPASALTSIEYWLTRAGEDHRTLLVPGRAHDEDIVLGSGSGDLARWDAMIAWIKARSA